MLMLLSRTHVGYFDITKLPQLPQHGWITRKEIAFGTSDVEKQHNSKALHDSVDPGAVSRLQASERLFLPCYVDK
jgi:hypothetical protein